MEFSATEFEGETTRKVLREMVEYVVASDESMESKRTRSGGRTDLNIYLCDNHDYEIGTLPTWITRLTEADDITGRVGAYVSRHTFSEDVVDESVSLVTISTPAKNREDEFLFVTTQGYLWVLTTVHSDWRAKTIENLLNYLPCVERLYLSADDLKRLTEDIEDSSISGFTAECHAAHRERDATLTFSGAEKGDLEKAEATFDAKPTRIEFDQTNSPETAIQGANTNTGRLTMRSVRRGSEGKAVETLLGLTDAYQQLDRGSFSVDHRPTMTDLGNGFAVDGFTAIELTEPDRDSAETGELVAEIEENVLNGTQYRYGTRDSGRKLRVFDIDHREMFDVAVEPPDIVLYARPTTTALSLRRFVRSVYERVDSTYSLHKSETPVATNRS